MFGRRSRRELEAENQMLWGLLRELMDLGTCSSCGRSLAGVCNYKPVPGKPVRINCPHYTKAEVGK